MFGSAFLKCIDNDVIDTILNDVQNSLKPGLFKNEHWYADYKRLRVIAVK